MSGKIQELLGDRAQSLLGHVCKTVPKEQLHLPGPDFIDRVFAHMDRKPLRCTTTAGSRARGTCRSCLSTRGSSTRRARRSRRTRSTSIRVTS